MRDLAQVAEPLEASVSAKKTQQQQQQKKRESRVFLCGAAMGFLEEGPVWG